jgi:anaerobic magnesium-protoporphyrin IX monomethyl ester cyclase
MSRTSRRILLIHPPYGDFTYPYHSLSYVAAPLEANGYTVDVIDLNAVWFRSVFTREQIRAWREEWQAELRVLEGHRRLGIGRQARLVELLRCLAIVDRLDPEAAVATLRSESFYDIGAYLDARDQVRAFEWLLSQLYGPYDFFSSFAIPPYEPCARSLVDKALASRRLIKDFKKILQSRYGGNDYLFCGASFPFSGQLVPGLAALQAAREVLGDTVLVAGGTAISDIYKYKSSAEALLPFHASCDCFYIAEAETGILELAAWCAGEVSAPPQQVVDLAAPGARPARAPVPYIALAAAEQKKFLPYSWQVSPPDYSWVEWDLYLAPERRVNYSPSRGCFWNQCTFCDYGLNDDGPTAPSRTMDVETVLAHLKALAQDGVRHVYLAVDAIAPKFLTAFTDGLLASGLDLHWSCQFFLTRSFTPELVRRLEASGLRLASFGLESGSSRVLELMGKGKNRVDDVLLPVLATFRESSSIGLQPLFFFGFPGETDADRQATVDLLVSHADTFSTITKGGIFALLPGAMVARNPQAFGVTGIRRFAGDDIAGSLEYEMTSGEPAPICDAFRAFNDQLPYLGLYERPWLGGIDTFHSQLYVERYGREVFHRLRQRAAAWEPAWTEVTVQSRFDLDTVLENVVIHNALKMPGARASLVAALPELNAEDLGALTHEVRRRPRRCESTIRFRPYSEPSDNPVDERKGAPPVIPGFDRPVTAAMEQR